MINPWNELPVSSPYVLSVDRPQIEHFNRDSRPEHCLRLEIFPEPFLGDPNAPIILLNLNPGFSKEDLRWHSKDDFQNSSLCNLNHGKTEYPFYLLNPRYSESPGHQWWERRLRIVIKEFGLETVANRMLCVELFPYHSEQFKHGELSVPSQQYGYHLVSRALERKAIVVMMRSKRLWLKAVPALANYNFHELKNPRSPYITPKTARLDLRP
jgi:hypothetical protein